jgi:hypothetical protein
MANELARTALASASTQEEKKQLLLWCLPTNWQLEKGGGGEKV